MPVEPPPARARFELVPRGRLEGAESPPGSPIGSRRVLHISLVLLIVGGTSLFAIFGRPATKQEAPTDGVASLAADGAEPAALDGMDGSATDGLALEARDWISLDGDDGTIAIAAFEIERAPDPVAVYVHEEGLTMSTLASADTVGEALTAMGVATNEADYVFPTRGTPLTAGAHIYVYHAHQIELTVGEESTMVYTRARSVEDALGQEDILLGPLDRVEPYLDTPIEEGLAIHVTQVREETETIEEVIPLSIVYEDDPELFVGQYEVLDWGEDGLLRREYWVVYEDGQEVERELVGEWEQPARDQVIAQGTKVANVVETPSGPLRYTQAFDVYTTWYSPADAGTPPDSPWYGITATGVAVRRGIVAVDPNVIPLGTHLYIPGYGEAIAADTGSGVIGYHIDLGFADYEVPDWGSGWATVYILEP